VGCRLQPRVEGHAPTTWVPRAQVFQMTGPTEFRCTPKLWPKELWPGLWFTTELRPNADLWPDTELWTELCNRADAHEPASLCPATSHGDWTECWTRDGHYAHYDGVENVGMPHTHTQTCLAVNDNCRGCGCKGYFVRLCHTTARLQQQQQSQ